MHEVSFIQIVTLSFRFFEVSLHIDTEMIERHDIHAIWVKMTQSTFFEHDRDSLHVSVFEQFDYIAFVIKDHYLEIEVVVFILEFVFFSIDFNQID